MGVGGAVAASHPPQRGSPVPSLPFQAAPSPVVPGGVLTRLLGLFLVLGVGCAAGDELDELDELEQPQLDCRPVRLPNCANAWNDRACFHVPPECATTAAPPEPEQ